MRGRPKKVIPPVISPEEKEEKKRLSLERTRIRKQNRGKPNTKANPLGRPESYTEDLGAFICKELMKGKTLTKICKDPKVPCLSIVYSWLTPLHPRYKEGFSKSYRMAREVQAEVLADQMLDIADDGMNDTYERWNPKTGKMEKVVDYDHIKRSALRVDTRKWEAAHMLPTKYSDRVQLTGKDNESLIPSNVKLVINFIEAEKKEDE
jgi:hypothetical protein